MIALSLIIKFCFLEHSLLILHLIKHYKRPGSHSQPTSVVTSMSKLSSSNNAAPAIICLTGSDNFNIWHQQLFNKCKTGFGRIGLNIIGSSITTKHVHPGDPPSELDLRLNPVSKVPIAGSLRYNREPLKEGESQDIFNNPLTPAAQAKYDSDTKSYDIKLEKNASESSELRRQDDLLYEYMLASISLPCQATIETHADFLALLGCPSDYYYRGKDYLAMTTDLFSTGSARLQTANILRVMNTTQDGPFAEYLQHFEQSFGLMALSLSDKGNPGFVSLSTLKFLLLTNGLDKSDAQNKLALNNYHIAYPSEMNAAKLIEALITANIGNLSAPDTTSVQGSALIAAAPKKEHPYGEKDPSRSDPHCTHCHNATKNVIKFVGGVKRKGPFFFYHALDHCHAKKKHDAAKNPKALIATTTTTAPAQSMWPPMEFEQMFNAQIAKQVAMDNVSVMSNINHSQP